MLRVALVVAIVGLALPGAARAYGWPVKPFDQMHAIRGSFDDPRFTREPRSDDELVVSFRGRHLRAGRHAGVRRRARHRRPRAAIGEPAPAEPAGVRLLARAPGHPHREHVRLHQLLGYVVPGLGARPLRRDGRRALPESARAGALTPYRDLNTPVVDAISVARLDGHTLQAVAPAAVSGTVGFIADAYELPSIAPPAPWNRSRLVPSLVRWRLIPANGDPPAAWRSPPTSATASSRSTRSRASTRPARTRTSLTGPATTASGSRPRSTRPRSRTGTTGSTSRRSTSRAGSETLDRDHGRERLGPVRPR